MVTLEKGTATPCPLPVWEHGPEFGLGSLGVLESCLPLGRAACVSVCLRVRARLRLAALPLQGTARHPASPVTAAVQEVHADPLGGPRADPGGHHPHRGRKAA